MKKIIIFLENTNFHDPFGIEFQFNACVILVMNHADARIYTKPFSVERFMLSFFLILSLNDVFFTNLQIEEN